MSSTCHHNMVNVSPLTVEIGSTIWGTPANFLWFPVLAASLHGIQYWTSGKLCGVEQRAPPMFGRVTITFGIGPHSSLCLFLCCSIFVFRMNVSSCHRIVSFGQGSSLLWTQTLRPFYSRPIALTEEGRSLVNDVCECAWLKGEGGLSSNEQLVRYL